ncbi:vWA domain-containing protein [Cylindrospermopsis raciborskii]|uniref:vWA domain-containing protein n=1 Tax=Cylindrospermopsis raciborskii TaxID=77022 RepID=UPI0038D087FD
MLNVVKKNYTLSYFRLKTCLIGKSLPLSLFLMSSLISPTLAVIKKAEIVDSPTIKDDRVTIKIKVLGEESRPVMGLERNNFELKLDGKKFKFKPKDWKSPEETVPPPAWIIVLLDFSGSMNQTDSGGSKKITGAINAIGQFAKVSSERGGDTQISIVPFGEAGKNCPEYPVDKDTLDKFISASDFKLQNSLEYLSTLNPCGSTNLYQPLKKALQFLGNPEDPRFTLPENSSDPQPRLSIILLSDGRSVER